MFSEMVSAAYDWRKSRNPLKLIAAWILTVVWVMVAIAAIFFIACVYAYCDWRVYKKYGVPMDELLEDR